MRWKPGVRLRIGRQMPELEPALEAMVAAIWARACAQRPLFNGRVFAADRIGPGEIMGHWTEYRRVTAQIVDPSLVRALGVRSMAVCGVLHGPDGVAVARRHPASAYQAGEWQLPPAGSVDDKAACPGGASWRHAVLAELREELGLHEAEIGGMRPLCLVEHPTGVLDMGIALGSALTAEAIRERHRSHGDGEYDALFVAPPARIAAEVATRGGTLVPSAAAFLALLG